MLALRDGEPVAYTADVVVVSGGAINSAALLLRSSSERHPRGLANGSAGQRYLTCRTWAGLNGFYAASDPTFASVGSDYSLVVRLRVVNRGAKVLRNGLLRYVDDTILADSTTGKILETEAQHIDEDITQQLVDALQNSKSRSGKPHVSSVSARVNRTDAILTTSTLTGTAAIQPAGYATAISFTIGFTGATVAAAA